MPALDLDAQKSLSEVGHKDILIGIPSYNSATTIGHVITQSARGLFEYFSERESLILVSDGGSTDGTLQIAKDAQLTRGVGLITCRYQGVPGKGSAVRAIFEAALDLHAKSIAMVDSDLHSITPCWIKLLICPTLNQAALVTPRYDRHKYDGTITNQLCYPLTRALYGKRIRQPIGGEFGLSARLAERLMESPLWRTPFVPKFGIDTFITSSALAAGCAVEEADLGAKIHEPKDPASQLASMFIEVAGSALVCMEKYEDFWKKIRGSSAVPLHKNGVGRIEPPPVAVSLDRLIEESRTVYSRLDYFKSVLSPDLRRELDSRISAVPKDLEIPTDVWAKTVYEVSARFKKSDEIGRGLLLEGLRAVWNARVATFVRQTAWMTNEEAEREVEEDAVHFEKMKSELLRMY
jgi:glycosyltransferase involved in cell wall biosynthesis